MRGPLERAAYLHAAGRARERADLRPLAYALMSTHVHWAITETTDPHRAFLHPLHSKFGRCWNRVHGGFGPVFAERPTSIVLTTEEQLARLIAYIHNNPTRAGLVTDPAQSDWTSHRAYLGLCEPPPWLDVESTLAAMGFSASPSGRLAFHDFVCARASLPRDPTLAGPGPVGPRFTDDLLLAVSSECGVAPSDIPRPGRNPTALAARVLLIHTARTVFGVSGKRLAVDLGLSTAQVCRASQGFSCVGTGPRAAVARVVDRYLEIAARRAAEPAERTSRLQASPDLVQVVR